jgi:CBS domain-containing protein
MEPEMNAGSIMSTTKIVAPANATGRELVFYMDLGGFSAVPITDAAGRIMGIVSEKDLMQALVAGTALDQGDCAESHVGSRRHG